MKPTAADILSRTTGGRSGNTIVDTIRTTNASLTDGDQLASFVERNRSLIKEFVLVVCGFLIFIMIILFIGLLATILLDRERINKQQTEYNTAFLANLEKRN
ncbi:cyun46 [Cyclophragma undans nucleopolyhedrovirus]|uniref:Cyun46 n=1 Tax=Cyclophragma undans nucleopolyhedrovirus TaxID=1906244 RepID=A0A288Q802_9ABAC|nr:cyun46 [Cyclophragma undans nucleopolyhedrovirus]AOT85516.1 cyun46 [Cyclophragma undans nucleopolyhedrovirus]